MSTARRALRAALALAAIGAVACSALTGASDYAAVPSCTGPLCAVTCSAQGGTWQPPPASVCTCGSQPLCGGSEGTCCDDTAPNCVTTATGAQHCSPCTQAAYECGSVCCEGQTCLNSSLGACGVAYGAPKRSCGSGLACTIPMLDAGIEDADCCASLSLPGGSFPMGLAGGGKNQCPAVYIDDYGCTPGGDETPAHTVTLSPFALDRFEVTVGRFRAFALGWDYQPPPAGAGATADVAGSGWQSAWDANLPGSRSDLERDVGCLSGADGGAALATWTSAPGANENLPIVCLTWFEAFAFCAWDGGRLPTEAEWEYAAGNGEGDLYPWGSAAATAALANFDCQEDPVPCVTAAGQVLAVGSLPAGENRWGHRDLAGNVDEWVLDSWAPYPPGSVMDYAAVIPGFRVNRGGDFTEDAASVRAAARSAAPPDALVFAVGVRCAHGS